MKRKNAYLLSIGLMIAGFYSTIYAAQPIAIDSLQPTAKVVTPKANLLLTLDDSGSMNGKVDGTSSPDSSETPADAWAPKSYDHTVIYPIPPNLDGTPRTDLDLLGSTQGYIDPFWGDMGNPLGGNLTRFAGIGLSGANVGSNIENIFNSRINIYWAYSVPYGNPAWNRQQFRINPTWTPTAAGLNGYGPVVPRCPSTAVLTTRANNVRTLNAGGAGIDPSLETLVGQTANCRVWWTYYKARHLALKSALTIALAEQDLSKVRISWQFLGDNNIVPILPLHDLSVDNNQGYKNMMLEIYKQKFYNGTPLTAAAYRGYDALTQSSPAVNDPYRELSADGRTPGELKSCRQSYHVLMTDGDWNVTERCDSLGNCATIKDYAYENSIALPTSDSSVLPLKISLPSTANYSAAEPMAALYRTVRRNNKTSLSDLALHYWARDIRTDLDNNISQYVMTDVSENFVSDNGSQVLTPFWNYKNDPATWQHVVTYGITFGRQADDIRSAPAWAISDSGATNQAEYDEWALLERITNDPYYLWWENSGWGTPEDVKHATYNGRGQYFSANTATGLVDAFKTIFANIANRQAISRATGATVAKSSAGDEELLQLYVSEFDSDTFDGRLKALKLYDGDEANYVGCFGGSTTPRAKGELCDPIQENWDASTVLPSWNTRQIYTRDLTVVPPLFNQVSFDTTLPLTTKQIIDTALTEPELDQIIEYIRGDQSNELLNSGTFRNRASLLGDVGRSNIVFSKEAALLAGHPDIDHVNFKNYHSTMNTKYKDGIVYVGANDGMLHAFNARTGIEKFAYIPSMFLSKLDNLTASPYIHTAFVDGKLTIKDVDLDGVNWSRVLVGALGAGGKGLFALDVTDPANPKLLWEIDETIPEFSSVLGYITSQVVITQLEPSLGYKDGRWVAITGNGYNSGAEEEGADDVSSLLVIDLETGKLLSQINVPGNTAVNGLGEVVVIDEWHNTNNHYGGDYRSDMAYAGDLQGNLWKFDLRKIATSTMPLILNPAIPGKTVVHDTVSSDYVEPLFKAENRAIDDNSVILEQPITAGVEVLKHPTGQGKLIYFGTGSLFSESDISSEVVNSFYAVWDNEFYDPTSGKGVIDRSRLRPIELNVITYAGKNYFQLAPNQLITKWPDEFFSSLTSSSDPSEGVMGWYVDFSELTPTAAVAGTGEINPYRAWQRPYLTKAPSGETVVGILPTYMGALMCDGANSNSSLLLFNPRDASQSFNVANIDLNGDGEINSEDLNTSLPGGVLANQLMGQELEGLIYNPAISSGVEPLTGSNNKTDCNNWQSTLADSTGGLDVSNVCVAKYIGSWLEIIK